MKLAAISLAVLAAVAVPLMFGQSYGEHLVNTPFVLEGSGFVVSKDEIKVSEINFGMISGSSITRTPMSVDDGFFTMNADDFDASEFEGSFLRDGSFFRLSGSTPDEVTVRFFGRLVEQSSVGSVYGVTGVISQGGVEYKAVYTTKLSKLDVAETVQTSNDTASKGKENVIKILKGASSRSFGDTYVDAFSRYSDSVKEGEDRAHYFTKSRISIKPGDSITFINEDTVPHTILSGKQNYNDRHNQYVPDGRINSGQIEPGDSVTITFTEPGFYRLFDPKYEWMNVTVYAFPGDVLEQLVGRGSKALGN